MKVSYLIAAVVTILAIAWIVIFIQFARATPNWRQYAGEWNGYHLTEPQLEWFRNVRPQGGGNKCCDIGDGHPVADWKIERGHFIALYGGKWWTVPDGAVVYGPVPFATIWLTTAGDAVRCFSPGAEG